MCLSCFGVSAKDTNPENVKERVRTNHDTRIDDSGHEIIAEKTQQDQEKSTTKAPYEDWEELAIHDKDSEEGGVEIAPVSPAKAKKENQNVNAEIINKTSSQSSSTSSSSQGIKRTSSMKEVLSTPVNSIKKAISKMKSKKTSKKKRNKNKSGKKQQVKT